MSPLPKRKAGRVHRVREAFWVGDVFFAEHDDDVLAAPEHLVAELVAYGGPRLSGAPKARLARDRDTTPPYRAPALSSPVLCVTEATSTR